MPYQVYVIELSKSIFSESKKFRDANPQYNGVNECLYVGMTSKSPKERFLEHTKGKLSKRGHDLSARLVKKYGLFLRPSLYKHISTIKSKKEALETEKNLALQLRRARYAVWFN